VGEQRSPGFSFLKEVTAKISRASPGRARAPAPAWIVVYNPIFQPVEFLMKVKQ
jgi:hypothetical protein